MAKTKTIANQSLFEHFKTVIRTYIHVFVAVRVHNVMNCSHGVFTDKRFINIIT